MEREASAEGKNNYICGFIVKFCYSGDEILREREREKHYTIGWRSLPICRSASLDLRMSTSESGLAYH